MKRRLNTEPASARRTALFTTTATLLGVGLGSILKHRRSRHPRRTAVQPETRYANSDDEAQRRANDAANDDPFPQVLPALLSSEHVQAYVKQTAMLHPFYPERDAKALKAASYEIRPEGKFVCWEDGKKIVKNIDLAGEIVLPANSISFVQLESKIRLPHYIAMRFNLRIKHVHRGLLLGTGPLVDPGFQGELLIPLHNLTSDKYSIRGDEGLIWVEFTKTSWSRGLMGHNLRAIDEEFVQTDPEKTNRRIEYYFEKANQNRPIESSIPEAIKIARSQAGKAAKDANAARRTNFIFTLSSVGVLVGLVAAYGSFLWTASSDLRSALEKDTLAQQDAKQALKDVNGVEAHIGVLESKLRAGPAAKQVNNTAQQDELSALKDRVARLEALLARGASSPDTKARGGSDIKR